MLVAVVTVAPVLAEVDVVVVVVSFLCLVGDAVGLSVGSIEVGPLLGGNAGNLLGETVGSEVGKEAVGEDVDPLLGDDVGTVIGEAVGSEVGSSTAGEDVPQPFATRISTSAQFQNCSGTPRPSGGMESQTGTFPGWNPSGQS